MAEIVAERRFADFATDKPDWPVYIWVVRYIYKPVIIVFQQV